MQDACRTYYSGFLSCKCIRQAPSIKFPGLPPKHRIDHDEKNACGAQFMKLFHGTTKENLTSIQSEGVSSPSYWGTEIMAREYANSFGDEGVVLVAEIDESDLEINQLVADQLYEEGEIDEMPDECDLQHSLEYLEGLVCTTTVFHAEIFVPEPAKPEASSLEARQTRSRRCDDEGFTP